MRAPALQKRLTASFASAVVFHGLLFVGLDALGHRAARPARHPEPLAIEVVPARPDPVADPAPSLAPDPVEPIKPAPVEPVRPPPKASPPRRHAPATVRPAPSPAPVAEATPSAADAAPAADTAAPSAAPAAPGAAPTTDTAPPSAPPAGASHGNSLIARPNYRTNPRPDYPIESQRRRDEGVVWLTVSVGADGSPASVSLHKSSGFPLLDEAAIAAVRRWTFEPERHDGTPVASTVTVPVRFTLSRR